MNLKFTDKIVGNRRPNFEGGIQLSIKIQEKHFILQLAEIKHDTCVIVVEDVITQLLTPINLLNYNYI